MSSTNYGWAGRRASSARARLAHTLPAPCYRCGGMIPSAAECKELGIKWDVEHTVSLAEGGTDDLASLSVSHSRCNRSHGGKLAQARKAEAKIVRSIETERTHKFWRVASIKNKVRSFSRAFRIVLDGSPTFFVSSGIWA